MDESPIVDESPVPARGELARDEHRALGWAALVALAAIAWLVMPIGVGILLGAFLGFMAQPVFAILSARIGARWAAIVTVASSMLLVAGVFGGLAWLLIAKGTALANQLMASFAPGGVGTSALAKIATITARFGVTQPELVAWARGLVNDAAAQGAGIAEALASTLGSVVLGLLFAMLSMHYIVRNWQTVSRRAEETFPLRPEYTAKLFAEFRSVGRTTLLGAVGTAIVQGVVGTIGYWIADVPEPIFFGAATAIASFVPGVGTLLVIVPVAFGLFLVEYPGHAIIELVWGVLFVVGACDYIVRPQLVSGGSKVPSLVTFAALFGGIEVFGLQGLFIGPVMMALAIAVLRLYASEARKRRAVEPPLPEANADPADDRAR